MALILSNSLVAHLGNYLSWYLQTLLIWILEHSWVPVFTIICIRSSYFCDGCIARSLVPGTLALAHSRIFEFIPWFKIMDYIMVPYLSLVHMYLPVALISYIYFALKQSKHIWIASNIHSVGYTFEALMKILGVIYLVMFICGLELWSGIIKWHSLHYLLAFAYENCCQFHLFSLILI